MAFSSWRDVIGFRACFTSIDVDSFGDWRCGFLLLWAASLLRMLPHATADTASDLRYAAGVKRYRYLASFCKDHRVHAMTYLSIHHPLL